MSQLMNLATNTGTPVDAPMKRKRGRPRKDENHLKPPVPITQGEASGVPKPTPSFQLKDKECIEAANDDDHSNDHMVGKMVTGVLEYAFDAGYFLTVSVGDNNVCMRGVVFKEGCVVPITPENDIAPCVKMYKKSDIPIPAMKSSPQTAPIAGISSMNPTEHIDDDQQMKEKSIIRKEDHNLIPEEQSSEKKQLENFLNSHQQKLSNDEMPQKNASDDKEQPRKLSEDKEEEKLTDDNEGLRDSFEPPLKLQKTDQTIASFVNEGQIKHSGICDENPEDAVKTDALANIIVSPETLDDSSVVVPTAMGQTEEFQISMEDEEDEDELSEMHSELSPKAAE